MTIKYNNIYIKCTSTVAGKFEKEGPLSKYFDKTYDDFYMGEKTFEQGEIKMILDNIDILLNKAKMDKSNIDLFISGDLMNQITPSSYAATKLGINYMGIYGACSSICLSMITASSMLLNKEVNNCICNVSANNSSSEKQYRNPTEYGTPKPPTSTFTATGCASAILTKEKSNIKIESVTIGKAVDYGIKDVYNMGAAMAPSASYTISKHLEDLNRSPDYYDLILTGDLGIYGKNILKEYMMTKYNIKLKDNYNDCGTMIYDLDNQPVLAGGSGPVCSFLVVFGYIYKEMLKGKYKKVLIIPTGAIFSPTLVFQKESIPSIANAISLEVIE